ncbi:MAG: DUF1573 domain-containing protein [Chitinophagaceae bacterium]|jgi:hypothetical protein|nr:DUF1573 domain-containing protein [Chitinophagaceae bacterium]MBP6047474.1 DUF1573 domain-containing protein [Ferruginibacter sp.]NMD28870.1 DUF1573 domain-containing protein [Bacteroidota bacterium]MBK7087851.1 DUF1573 domain-containing protein [Chitinophagaceae bacterium]MBK7345354.1 DUF1573 domain-containing protein [Chitinophagaceae bacterium]
MKYLVTSICIVVTAFSFNSCDVRKRDKLANESSAQNMPVIKDSTTVQIIDSSYNFGKITDGEIVAYNFRFKNTGSKPLIIVNTAASCGCTVPEKPDQPVLPGETGFIKVKFDSHNRVGQAHKTIAVTSNANPPFTDLVLTGEVVAANKK